MGNGHDTLTVDDLRVVADRVGEMRGWDFSRVRAIRDAAPWEYEDIVTAANPSARATLDIGTGGGEKLRSLVGETNGQRVVAVDHSLRMLDVAAVTLAGVAEVVAGEAAALPFPSESFDLVLERHASVHPAEVVRVLRAGGTFITQQVGPRNTQSIFDAFGWGSNWDQFAHDVPPPRPYTDLAEDFAALGCRVERVDEYEVGYAFEDIDSLVFFLKAAPFPEEFDPAHHAPGINRLLEHHRSERGIETTEHRELLVVTRGSDGD